MRDLAGRSAVVTGASRGIGRGIALELALRGARVAITYRRDEDAAQEALAQIERSGGEAIAIRASMTEQAEIDHLADRLLAEWNGVDILVHNAGVASRGLSVAETDPAELERVIRTHALGPHRLTQRLLPAMRERPRGDIIMISSSEVSHMRANGGPYNMAKAALEALALTVAHEEIHHRIRVNIVAPGLVITDMGVRLVRAKLGIEDVDAIDAQQPLRRVPRPVDVAQVVGYLVSDAAAFISGQRIAVDGGAGASPTAFEPLATSTTGGR